MKCANCRHKLEKIIVEVEGAKNTAKSLQCQKCGYFIFVDKDFKKVVNELKQNDK